MDVKEAIRSGDAEALHRLLTEDASRANALIRWGKDGCVHTHPLHYVSDMLFAVMRSWTRHKSAMSS